MKSSLFAILFFSRTVSSRRPSSRHRARRPTSPTSPVRRSSGAAGSVGGDSATSYIARRYLELGPRGAFPADCQAAPRCPAAILQFFTYDGRHAKNVAAVIAGSDSSLRSQYVVIGAHYDHLGRSPTSSNDPELGFIPRLGADDNASGTAGVLELARRFALRPARGSILVANFDAPVPRPGCAFSTLQSSRIDPITRALRRRASRSPHCLPASTRTTTRRPTSRPA